MSSPFATPALRLKNDLEGGEDVWAFVNRLRIKHNAINHGQGFPNWSSPQFVKQAVINAVTNDFNQYAPNTGLLELKKQIAKETSLKYGNRFALNENNIQITNGCAGALDCTFRAFLNPGDEVIAIEPFFTFYRTQICHSGGVLKTVALDLKFDLDRNQQIWSLDVAKLKAAINERTRILVLNTPHNPTGFVLSLHEMQQIAQLIRAYPKLLVVTDEVYDRISSVDVHHFAALSADTFARTIVCCSAAKTFSVTGWKIGWTLGPASLIRCINFTSRGHSWSVNTPCQRALVDILRHAQQPYQGFPTYYAWLNDMYSKKRERMLSAITQSGMSPITPNGAYYIMVDASKYMDILRAQGVFKRLNLKDPTTYYDWQFCAWLIENVGVAVVPGSAFYDYSKFSAQSKFKFIRFAYCTSDDTIAKTAKKLKLIAKLLQPQIASKL
mmetsp:Transcript_22901/g.36770  ORF Transcript_22901/g.36770 Transcript_22901/m.36770 type:complete len:441 (+) Transcript_22901:37-1359(+)